VTFNHKQPNNAQTKTRQKPVLAENQILSLKNSQIQANIPIFV